MAIAADIIFRGLFASFLAFAGAEAIKPGSAADFMPISWLFILLLAAGIAALWRPEGGRGRVYPLISVSLTLLVLLATIVFAWKTGSDLGKINFLIVFGAAAVASGALKIFFEHNE